MIKEEIERLKIDIEDAMMSGDYESIVKVLQLIIDKIEELVRALRKHIVRTNLD